jgi:hypothetical protein
MKATPLTRAAAVAVAVAITATCADDPSAPPQALETPSFSVGSANADIEAAGPPTSNVVATPNPAEQGASVAVTADVDDSSTGGSAIMSAEFSLDGGMTWSPAAPDDGDFDEVAEGVNASFTAPATPGIYDLCVRGTDENGNIGDPTCIMFVVYDPAAGFVTGGGFIDSGAGATLPISAVWDQGFEGDDGGWLDNDDLAGYGYLSRVPSGSGGIASASGGFHAIAEGFEDDCPAYQTSVPSCFYGPFSRFDMYRYAWPGTWTAEVDVYLDPAWAAGEGFDYSVAAAGTDGTHQRDFIFHIAKDISTGDLLVGASNNTNFAPRQDLESIDHYTVTTAGWYTLQHVYRDQGGTLAVDLNLLDSGGNVLSTETRNDASDLIPAEVGGNFYAWFTHVAVDGGIAIDDHRLFLRPTATGKANFGFVAKYQKKSNLPDGNTQFVFQAGGINFHSTSYDWLVINQGGSNAQFKGSGTINGAGDYRFMLWAGDGNGPNGEDTFRIKIWQETSGDVIVYDNGMSQPIGGGSIKIHQK